jgi:HEAT repeat protein
MSDDEVAISGPIERLLDEDQEARYETAREISRMGRPVIPRLLALADDPRPRMRAMVCYILGQIGDRIPGEMFIDRYPEGIPTLLRLLESDPDEEVREGAAAALGHHAVPCVLPALCRAAAEASAEIRYAVAWALGGTFGDGWTSAEARRHRPEVIRTLLRLMDDEDEDVRDWATFGIHLGEHDTPEVRARLWQALDDPFSNVRAEAALGLARLGDRALIPRLEPILREDDECQELHFEAAMALGDPCLLDAVREGAEHWSTFLDEGEEVPWKVTRAIEVLQQAADRLAESGASAGTPSTADEGNDTPGDA